MRSPLLSRPGAVAGRTPDDAVAGHYGDPLREQRTLIENGGVVDRSHRGVVTVTGPDRLSWLHSVTSQHLTELSPETWTEALVLSPHGHVEHHLALVDDGTTTWIHVEPATAPDLVAYLDSMRFMLRVEVADVTSSYAVVTAVPGGDRIVPRDSLEQTVDAAGLPLVGHDAWEALRVADGRPRLGFETDHRTIPHEVGWIGPAVHLDKGCYRGQETVARVHNLGRPPRRLVLLHLDGTEETLPRPHEPVLLDDRQVGFLGTAVHHADLGPIALAVVKRSTADDAHLVVAGMAAKPERLVDA
ncbi:MAG TPA: glycine cleavage T C-terminal barrel domain-containing protein [Mycobacteriales bacterium]|nr:glycine cleavage T C-terminal barrel domain-containing protein [Mycobacteriales bacterium]